jgi:ferredoxin-NADP reductase
MPQKLLCEVEEVIHHGGQVYSVILRPEHPVMRFLPGQFLHLTLENYQPGDFWPESRVYSIASAPAERDLLRITYAVKGNYTSRMEAELHPGRMVWVKLPYGDFIVTSEKDVCILAGGTGITAFTAFISSLGPDYPHQVTLFYGARRPDLLIYRSLVDTVAARCPNLHAHFLVEEASDGTDCLPGRIEILRAWEYLPSPLRVHYYLSGPPDMLHKLTAELRGRDVPSGQIHIDAWE